MRLNPNEVSPTVCVVGAGFAGILAGIKLKTALGIEQFTIYDENEEVGGTWLVNHYPGAGCDVPSHLYCYSFEMSPEWTQSYASQKEILNYLTSVARKYNLYEHIQFSAQVKRIEWKEELRKWKITIFKQKSQHLEELFYDIVINGPGSLRQPNIPEIFDSFQGPKFHTANWNKSIDLENKIVGVVGNGASAVQVIPELVKVAKELHCFQRSPTWVVPRNQFQFHPIIRKLFAKFWILLLLYRWFLFITQEIIYWIFMKNSFINKYSHYCAINHLYAQVKDPYLRIALLPNFTIGCKRLAVSSDYFPAFEQKHVKLHSGPITKVLPSTILTGDTSQEIEILVLATGFRVQDYFSPIIIIGEDGKDLGAKWAKTGPQTFLGISVSTLPNFFFLLGAQGGVSHNSLIFMAECQMAYVCQCIEEMMKKKMKLIRLKGGVEETFGKRVRKQTKRAVWTAKNCTAWFKNDSGEVTAFWPWTCAKYWFHTLYPDFSNYDFE